MNLGGAFSQTKALTTVHTEPEGDTLQMMIFRLTRIRRGEHDIRLIDSTFTIGKKGVLTLKIEVAAIQEMRDFRVRGWLIKDNTCPCEGAVLTLEREASARERVDRVLVTLGERSDNL